MEEKNIPVTVLLPRISYLLGIEETRTGQQTKDIEQGIKDLYNSHREELLQSHYWAFAEKPVVLRRTSVKPAWGYDFYCDLPPDYLSLTYLNFTGDLNVGVVSGYQLFGKRIAVNTDPVYISYTRDEQDFNKFSPMFKKALAFGLAYELSLPVVGDKDLGERLDRKMQEIKFDSIEIDYRDQGTRETVQGRDVLNSRIGGFLASGGGTPGVVVEESPLPGLVTPEDN